MTDVITSWEPWLLQGDWVYDPAISDLASGRDLETSAIISLFTDRLAHVDDVLPDPQDDDRRGWWADWDADEGPIGSRLWLLTREKQTEDVRLRAEDYCREALQWMLDDDVADTVGIHAEWNRQAPGRLDVDVVIVRERRELLRRRFSWAWRQIIGERPEPPRLPPRPTSGIQWLEATSWRERETDNTPITWNP